MNKTELAQMGIELAARLDELSKDFHVKSGQHEILIWEADILRAKAQDLSEDCGLLDTLKASALLSPWGKALALKMPSIAKQVSDFHARYNMHRYT